MAELKRLMEYRAEMGAKDEDFRGLGLTSRRNLCLHPEVREYVFVVETQLACAAALVETALKFRSARRRRESLSIQDVEI